ncbi:tigger transposable element-derived protein 1-like [Palaemon carinicauda]|uniref:tigger transposable element-derived protein 1-like n=1 Tax=Palaemon carinicauda TaxID=392227 RepID=UPI0035B5D215
MPLYSEAVSADTDAARRYVETEFPKMIKDGQPYDEASPYLKTKNPLVLKNKHKAMLPIYWMDNAKTWIIKALTANWFIHCFVPEAKLYLAEKGLPFKVLLLMDCAGGHATDLQYERVQVEFLPPNTKGLIQPMDQRVIRACKALYT